MAKKFISASPVVTFDNKSQLRKFTSGYRLFIKCETTNWHRCFQVTRKSLNEGLDKEERVEGKIMYGEYYVQIIFK